MNLLPPVVPAGPPPPPGVHGMGAAPKDGRLTQGHMVTCQSPNPACLGPFP